MHGNTIPLGQETIYACYYTACDDDRGKNLDSQGHPCLFEPTLHWFLETLSLETDKGVGMHHVF